LCVRGRSRLYTIFWAAVHLLLRSGSSGVDSFTPKHLAAFLLGLVARESTSDLLHGALDLLADGRVSSTASAGGRGVEVLEVAVAGDGDLLLNAAEWHLLLHYWDRGLCGKSSLLAEPESLLGW